MSVDVYGAVTEQIVAMLDAGVVPWRSPIVSRSKAGWPKNLVSGKEYRGVNVFLLAFTAWTKGYESAEWLTFNQAKELGGGVRKGERSSMVVFWKSYETTDKETGEPVTVPVLRYYNLFNVEQCDGVTGTPIEAVEPPAAFTPIESAERIAQGYTDGPNLQHVGSQAFYLPAADTVRMPKPFRFVSPEEYYCVLFHEQAHSTGHSKRLNRKLDTAPAPFGSPDYGREELVAEMAAAFLCGDAGIIPVTVENSAAYIGNWIKTLQGDKRLAIAAAGAAQKAADWIRGIRNDPRAEPSDVQT